MNLAERGLLRGARLFNKNGNKISDSIQTDDGYFKEGTKKLSICAYSCITRVAWPFLFFTMLVYCWLAVKSMPYRQHHVVVGNIYPVQRLDDTLNKLSNGTFKYSYQDWTKTYSHSDDSHDSTANRKENISDQQQHVGLSMPDQNAANEIRNGSYFTTPIDKHDYNYIHNPESLCKIEPKKVFLLIMIISAPMNAVRRDIIRLTYGNPKEWLGLLNRNSIVQIAFLLGKTNNATLQVDIDKESDLHSDIIQEDFIDSSNNLTMKTVMGLKWVTSHCRHASHVMKCDDTSIIIQPKLFVSVVNAPTSEWAGGFVNTGSAVVRDANDEYYISEEFYPYPTYPPFLNGHGYILSTDLVEAIYKVAIITPLFPREDVFIGLCLQKLNVTPNNINDFVKYFPEDWLTDFQDNMHKRQMVKRFSVISNLDPQHMTMIWEITKVIIRNGKSLS